MIDFPLPAGNIVRSEKLPQSQVTHNIHLIGSFEPQVCTKKEEETEKEEKVKLYSENKKQATK